METKPEEQKTTPHQPELAATEIVTEDHERRLVPVLVIAAEAPEKEWTGKSILLHSVDQRAEAGTARA